MHSSYSIQSAASGGWLCCSLWSNDTTGAQTRPSLIAVAKLFLKNASTKNNTIYRDKIRSKEATSAICQPYKIWERTHPCSCVPLQNASLKLYNHLLELTFEKSCDLLTWMFRIMCLPSKVTWCFAIKLQSLLALLRLHFFRSMVIFILACQTQLNEALFWQIKP